MGQKQTKQNQVVDASEVMRKQHRVPVDVVVDRPELAERAGKPVLNIPNSTYRVLYIDPGNRMDVVARHGYIALRTDGVRAGGGEENDAIDADELESHLPGKRRRDSEATDGGDPFGRPSNVTGEADDLDVDSNDGDTKPAAAARGKDEFGGSGVKRRGSGNKSNTGTLDRTSKHQQFLYPVGRYSQTKVYFEDAVYPEDIDNEHDGTEAQVYEHEEDEICEMAGVPRIVPRQFEPTEADLTYELPCKVLDALRMAIEAPMEKFQAENKDADDMIAQFKAQAMEQMALLRDPFADQGEQELVVIAAPTIDHQMSREEAENKIKIKRRKKLHKDVNTWRSSFEAANGRKPSTEEMHADPDFGPLYREYIALKRETRDDSASPARPELGEDPFADPSAPPPASNPATALLAPPRSLRPVTAVAEPAPPSAAAQMIQRQLEQQPADAPTSKYRSLPADQKANVKHLVKTMRAWKQEFVGIHGVPASRADMVQDPAISDVYLGLRKVLGSDDADITDDEAVVQQKKAEAQQQQMAEAQQQHKAVPTWQARVDQMTLAEKHERRRELGRMLNIWKAEFLERESRRPHAGDIADDHSIAALYEEYAALPKPDDEERAPSQADARRGTSVSPAATSFESPEAERQAHKRRKAIGRELNAWKQQWAEEHNGEAPTQEDVERDPVIAQLYFEYVALPSKSSAKNATADGSADATDSPVQSTDRSMTPTSTSSPKRRKQLGKQLNAWKARWAEEHNGEAPTQEDLEADPDIAAVYNEYKALSGRRDSRATSVAGGVASASTDGLPQFDRAESGDPLKRRKQLGKILTAWKAKWADTHGGEPPTHADLEGDPEIAAIYAEYKSARRESRAGQDEPSVGRDSGSVARRASVAPHEVSKRRKYLAKELNAWKAQFEDATGQAPTTEDMIMDPNIRVLYEEYKSLKERRQSTTAGTPADESGTVVEDTGIATVGDESPSVAREGTDAAAAEDELQSEGRNRRPSQDVSSVAKRRKALGKELNAWKAAFLEANGRKPTTEDIAADPSISTKYEEYVQLKEGADESSPAGAATTAGGDDAGAGDSEALHKRRKKLGKQLNDWKKAFVESNGRQPTSADIAADATISAVFDEYQSIPKERGGGEGDGAATTGAADDGTAQSAVESVDKARKKMLAQQLNMWKEVFAAENGRAPKTEDILLDQDIAPVYEEYLVLKNKI